MLYRWHDTHNDKQLDVARKVEFKVNGEIRAKVTERKRNRGLA